MNTLLISLFCFFFYSTYNSNNVVVVAVPSPAKVAQYCKPTPSLNFDQCQKRITFCRKANIDLVWVGSATDCLITVNGHTVVGSGGCQCGKKRQDYCGFTCETECNNRSFCKWLDGHCKFADGSEWIPPTGNTCACIPRQIDCLHPFEDRDCNGALDGTQC
jgi:hypothetical protein